MSTLAEGPDEAAQPEEARSSASPPRRNPDLVLWLGLPLAGLGLAVCCQRLAALSQHFVYGHGHAQRPIPEFLLWMGAAFACYAAGVALILRAERRARAGLAGRGRSAPLCAWIVAVALLSRGLFLTSLPIQEVDYARYLWDGAVLARGVSPYRFTPREVFSSEAEEGGARRGVPAAGTDDAETLRALRDLRTDDPRAAEAHARINYPEVPTVYPPLAQAVFALAQRLSPWSLPTLRAFFLVCDALTLFLIMDTLLRLGLSPLRAAVFAWSPLAIKELANSPHLDVLLVCALALALWGWVAGRLVLVGAALGLGILAKYVPVLLLPATLIAAGRRAGARGVALVLLPCAAVVAAGYAPFWQDGPHGPFEGLAAFATGWRINSSLYGLTEWLLRAPGLAGGEWTVLGHACPAEQYLARLAVSIPFLAVWLGAACWPERQGTGVRGQGSGDVGQGSGEGESHTTRASQFSVLSPQSSALSPGRSLPFRWLLTLAALFFCAPTANPWYAVWLLPLLCIFPVRGLLLLTGLLPLYYLAFYFDYHEEALQAQGWDAGLAFTWVRWAEYAPVFALLAWDGWRARRPSA